MNGQAFPMVETKLVWQDTDEARTTYIEPQQSLQLGSNLVLTVYDIQNGVSIEEINEKGEIVETIAMLGGGGDTFDPNAVDLTKIEQMSAVELILALAKQNGWCPKREN